MRSALNSAKVKSIRAESINLCAETCAWALTLASRPNVTISVFIPDIIFSVDFAVNEAVAIGGVTSRFWLVLDFRYQLYEGAAIAKFQVRFHFRVFMTLLNTGPFAQGVFNYIHSLLPPERGYG